MFFILSKIFVYLLAPFTMICVLFLTSALMKKPSLKRKLFYFGLGFLFFFSNPFIANEVALLWELPITPFKELKRSYTWGIVLSGVTKQHEEVEDRVFFGRGADRVTHTVQLYKIGKIKKVLVSGGSGSLLPEGRKEADEIAEALLLMGVPDSAIVAEVDSRNTRESAVAVKGILKGKTNPSDCLLITSAFHMRRSIACFKKVGWGAQGFCTDFISHQRKFTIDELLIPSTEALDIWRTVIREWVGFISYRIVGYV